MNGKNILYNMAKGRETENMAKVADENLMVMAIKGSDRTTIQIKEGREEKIEGQAEAEVVAEAEGSLQKVVLVIMVYKLEDVVGLENLTFFAGPPPDRHPPRSPHWSFPTRTGPSHNPTRDIRQGSGSRHNSHSSSSDRAFETAPMYQDRLLNDHRKEYTRQSPSRTGNYQTPAVEDYLSTRNQRPRLSERNPRMGVAASQNPRRSPRGIPPGREGGDPVNGGRRCSEYRRNLQDEMAGGQGHSNRPRMARKEGSIHDEGPSCGWDEEEHGVRREPASGDYPPGDLGDPNI